MNLNKKKCLSCIVAFSVLFFAILFSIPNLMQNKKTQPVYAHEEIVESEEIKTAEVSPNMLKTDWASSDNLGIRPSAVTYLKFKSPSSSATTNEIDISAYGTGIYPYVDGTTLYIVSDNPIYAPEDCSNFFIKFNKSTEIHLDNFYTINTTNMCKMFYSCDFIQLVTSENFNTSNVTTMQGMFQGCNNLLGISGTEYWNTSNVEDMSHMFRGCNSLQSPKFSFNLSSCLTVNSMFYLSTVYDLTLTFTGNEHSTHNIDATDMFRQSSFRSVSIKGANLYNTLNMSNMFYSVSVLDTASITVTLTNLKTSNMRGMFYWSEIKTITFSAFDTSSCTNMSNTFKYCEALRTISGISTWDTQNVTDMSSMFYECINLKTMDDIGGWNTGNVMNMSHMFYKYRYETSSNISMDLSNWDVGKVTNMSHMFYLCGYLYLTSLGDLSNWDVSNVTDMNSMFYVDSYDLTSLGDLNKWDVSNVTDMNSMFRMCSGLLNLGDLKNWNVDNVTDMSYMFYNCANLTSVGNIESWKPKLNNLNSMFYDCNNLIELNLSNFDTSNVTDMSYMLHNCKNLTTIGDIGGWDTSKVLTMAYMFSNCTQLLDINVSNFDTSMCNNMTHMFDYCNTVSILDVSKFNTSLVTDMSHMFNGCSSISKLNLKSFDTSSVTSISYMFNGCKIKVLDLSNFNLSKCTTTRLYFGVGLQTLVMPYRGYTSTNANVQILFNTSYSSESPYYVTTKQTQANSNPFSILLSNNSVHKLALKRGSSSSTLPTNWFETFTSKNAEISDKSKVNSIKLEFYAPEDYILLTSVSGVAYYYKTNNNGLFDLLMASTSPIYAPSDAANLFSNFVNVTKIDLTNFWTATDTASLKRMFYNCPKLTNIDLSTFHTNNVTDFSEMFMGCSSLKTLNLAFLNMTSATSTTNMLAGCNSLKEIDAPHSTSSTVTIDLNTETQFYLKHTTTPVITQLTNDTTKYGFSVFSNKVDSNANLGQGDFYGDYVIEVETLVTLNSITYCDKDSMYFSGVFETDYPKTFYFGTEIDLTNVIPVKAHHSFGGWFLNYDCSGEPITLITEEMQEGNLTLYALWTPVKYTVNWFNFDGSLLYSAEETYGTLPTFKGDAPFRPNDSKFQYTFEGWSPNITAVEGITEYWATYSAVQKRFTITWINYNGVVLKNEEVDFEVVPNYDGITPTRDEDAQYIYTFSGWDKEIVPAIEDKIYVATFSTTTKTYKITWIDENDDILEIDEEVEYGTMPTYDGDTPTKETDAQYIYTFKGWYPLVEKVTGNATYKVTYTNTIRTYKITWKHSNGETLETDEAVPYGNNPSYDSTFPTINETEQYFYIFTGWTPTLSPVTGDKTYTAVFEEVIKTYTITWINEDNSLLEIDYYVPYGSNPIFNAAGPTMATDAQYIYEFKEWSPKITTVTSDATYKATYSKTIRTYTIIWSSYNGVLETDENIPYGTTPSFDKPEPYRPADAQYTYTFAGWNPEIDIVKGNITYTAIFTTTINTYTITWKDDDGTILQLDENIEYGVIPSYNGDDPSKSANVQYTYYFTGWTPKIDIVKADATYTATYLQKINTYTVTWLNYNDIVLKTEHNVEYGTIPNYGEPNPTRPTDAQYSYEFIGWNPQILEDTIITGNTVFVANYSTTLQTYTVVWTTYNGNVLETDTNVPYGATPSYEGNTPEKPKDNQFTYTFAGWSPTLSMVEGDIIYSAVFNETINTYTITWVDFNDTILETDLDVPYGAMPTFDGEEPKIQETAEFVYVFKGWTPSISLVTGHATYKATYNSTVRTYTILWLNYDKTLLQMDLNVAYGTTPTYNGETPVKPADAQYIYTFAGWAPSVSQTKDNIEYIATYTTTDRTYTVTWANYNGDILETDENVKYGSMPHYDGAMPTRPSENDIEYTFKGWLPELNIVTENITYVANFVDLSLTYTITWKNHDGTILKVDTNVIHGTTPAYTGTIPTKQEDNQYTYKFIGWNPEVTPATESTTYTAKFEEIVKTYTITWLNYDNTLLEIDYNVPYGATPSYDGATPSRQSDVQYSYTFTGWINNISSVTGDAEYIAKYNSTINTYSITASINSSNGTLTPIGTTVLDYNQSQTYNFSANEGYYIKRILIDGIELDNASTYSSYTFSNIQANHTLSIEIEKIKFTIIIDLKQNNKIFSNKEYLIEYGETFKLNIANLIDLELVKVYVDNKEVPVKDGWIELNNITSNISISAVYQQPKHESLFPLTITITVISAIIVITLVIILIYKQKHNYKSSRRDKDMMDKINSLLGKMKEKDKLEKENRILELEKLKWEQRNKK